MRIVGIPILVIGLAVVIIALLIGREATQLGETTVVKLSRIILGIGMTTVIVALPLL